MEILYRGKHSILDSKWIYGYYCRSEDCGRGIWRPTIIRSSDLQYFTVDRKTVGQYIGFEDRNLAKIFEGDWVRIHQFAFDGSDYGEVEGFIKRGEYGWLLAGIKGKEVNDYMGYKDGEGEIYLMDFYGVDVPDCYEIIGNIHDNPDLLEA